MSLLTLNFSLRMVTLYCDTSRMSLTMKESNFIDCPLQDTELSPMVRVPLSSLFRTFWTFMEILCLVPEGAVNTPVLTMFRHCSGDTW